MFVPAGAFTGVADRAASPLPADSRPAGSLPSVPPSCLTSDRLSFAAGGRVLLDAVSVSLPADTVTMILGPNGAGKSLFLRLCNGLLTPTGGSLTWTWRGGKPAMAMVLQAPVVLRRSVLGNMTYALKQKGVPFRHRWARGVEALERAGVGHLADRPARQLSGGEKQRVAIARAWAMEPDVLLLDEPTASLDPTCTHVVETLVREIHAAGTKIIMTSHDLGQARRLADDVLLLHKGRVCEHSPARAFFTTPRSEEGRRFLHGDLLA